MLAAIMGIVMRVVKIGKSKSAKLNKLDFFVLTVWFENLLTE